MIHKTAFISSVVSLGILLGMGSSEAIAQMLPKHMQPHATEKAGKFHQIAQPFWVKAAVTTGGLGLIGLELWWFLFSKSNGTKKISVE